MGWPQIVIIAFLAMDTGMSLAMHGKPREGKYNFWVSLISNGLLALLMWYGGFWR